MICSIPLWLAAGGAAAQTWQNELSEARPGAWPAITPTVLDFKVSWKGMLDAGSVRIEFAPRDAKKPGMLVVRSSSSSRGLASALFPYRGHYWSEIHPATLRPRFFHGVETDRREKSTTTVRHHPGRLEYLEINEPLNAGKVTRNTGGFRFDPVYDLFSAMLHVRSQRLNPGDRITLVVHPFRTPYLLRVRVIAREQHMDRPAIRIGVSMQKIDNKSLELRPYQKMRREATMWLSDDADRIPLELRASVFIGDVRATLCGISKIR
jgi:hypothetical protein